MSSRKRHLRQRHVSDSEESADETLAASVTSAASTTNKMTEEEDGLEEYEREERDRQEDLKERDAFVKRLLDRDHGATKKMAPSGSRSASRLEEDLKRLESGEVSKEELLAELKKRSRREYLRKRQADKLHDLEAEIRDEETLTEYEKAELEYKRTIMEVVTAHKDVTTEQMMPHYFIPTETKRPDETYYEAENEKGPQGESRRWEQEHISSALFSHGAKDMKTKATCYWCYRRGCDLAVGGIIRPSWSFFDSFIVFVLDNEHWML
ncbi:unnamed protein product [Schistocephalus solidus]|uniref:Microfibrillar-associated protein 1 n=1 Tax=Schistocephalus solidus TaxID=70667 RepID=A0A183TJ36_SCHSO|nr:unnamed protein product [Schistocephalus solidus]